MKSVPVRGLLARTLGHLIKKVTAMKRPNGRRSCATICVAIALLVAVVETGTASAVREFPSATSRKVFVVYGHD